MGAAPGTCDVSGCDVEGVVTVSGGQYAERL